MFKKLRHYARLVMGRRSPKPVVISRQDHCISRSLIDPDALKVMYRLRRAGYIAYLAGGGVRDLLLGRKPKDFDVVTDAHPRQIKRLFSNCFLVGRRFRLAHIHCGGKIIETSTFRRRPPADDAADEETLKHRRENTFGTPQEDARMRDFTINGLYYDVGTFSVIDHVGGQQDLERGLIRCIGDPDLRFPEDPVRMIRAVRFASRMGFTVEKRTYRAIIEHHREIENASPPRLLEEVYRLFGFGTGRAAVRMLADTGLLRVILPAIDAYQAAAQDGDLSLWACLDAADRMKPDPAVPAEAVILSALFYPLFDARLRRLGMSGDADHQELAREVLREAAGTLPVPRRIIDRMARSFDAQRRLASPPEKRLNRRRFVLQETFADALLLREMVVQARGGDLAPLSAWRELANQFAPAAAASPHTRSEAAPPAPEEKKRPARRRRRRKKPAKALADAPAQAQ